LGLFDQGVDVFDDLVLDLPGVGARVFFLEAIAGFLGVLGDSLRGLVDVDFVPFRRVLVGFFPVLLRLGLFVFGLRRRFLRVLRSDDADKRKRQNES
jgi:hypothetical protein